MSKVFDSMYTFFQNSKMEGSYILLFGLSIVILYLAEDRKNRWLAFYPLVLFAMVIANPLTVWILSMVFPVLGDYEHLAVLIPLLIYIPFGITELIAGLKSHRERLIVGFVLFVFVSVCGNLAGLFGGNTKTADNLYSAERKELVAYADAVAAEGGLVMADDEILPFLTSYGDNIPLLYGQDIMMFNGDLGIMDTYDEGIIAIHNMMWTPEEHIDSIAAMARSYGCDIMIVRRFEGAKIFAGSYVCDKQTENYLIYRKKDL